MARRNQRWRSNSQVKPMPPCSSVAHARRAVVEVGQVRLGERRVSLRLVADVVEGVRRVPPQRQRRLELGGEVGELMLDGLEGADRLAELLAGQRVAASSCRGSAARRRRRRRRAARDPRRAPGRSRRARWRAWSPGVPSSVTRVDAAGHVDAGARPYATPGAPRSTSQSPGSPILRRHDQSVGDRAVGHERLRAGERVAARLVVRCAPGPTRRSSSPSARVTIASPEAIAGSQRSVPRRVAGGLESAIVASATARNGPGVRGVAELLGGERQVEQLEAGAAVPIGDGEPRHAELGQAAPQRGVVSGRRSP